MSIVSFKNSSLQNLTENSSNYERTQMKKMVQQYIADKLNSSEYPWRDIEGARVTTRFPDSKYFVYPWREEKRRKKNGEQPIVEYKENIEQMYFGSDTPVNTKALDALRVSNLSLSRVTPVIIESSIGQSQSSGGKSRLATSWEKSPWPSTHTFWGIC